MTWIQQVPELRCESRLMWTHGVRARCVERIHHPGGDHHSGGYKWDDTEAARTVAEYGPPKRSTRGRPPLSPRLKAATPEQLFDELVLRLEEKPGPVASRLIALVRLAQAEQAS